jgi:hypothetical protein
MPDPSEREPMVSLRTRKSSAAGVSSSTAKTLACPAKAAVRVSFSRYWVGVR